MAQFPFRNPLDMSASNTEDAATPEQSWQPPATPDAVVAQGWTPPSYVLNSPSSASSAAGGWKPPSYVIEDAKPDPTITERIKSVIPEAKPFHAGPPLDAKTPIPPYDENKPDFKQHTIGSEFDTSDPESAVSRFKQGGAGFATDVMNLIKSAGKGAASGYEAFKHGDIKGAAQGARQAVAPVLDPLLAVQHAIFAGEQTNPQNKTPLPTNEERVKETLGAIGVPVEKAIDMYNKGDFAGLAGMGLTAAAVGLLAHKAGGVVGDIADKARFKDSGMPVRRMDTGLRVLQDGTTQQNRVATALEKEGVPRTAGNISAETDIPQPSVRRSIAEINRKSVPPRPFEKGEGFTGGGGYRGAPPYIPPTTPPDDKTGPVATPPAPAPAEAAATLQGQPKPTPVPVTPEVKAAGAWNPFRKNVTDAAKVAADAYREAASKPENKAKLAELKKQAEDLFKETLAKSQATPEGDLPVRPEAPPPVINPEEQAVRDQTAAPIQPGDLGKLQRERRVPFTEAQRLLDQGERPLPLRTPNLDRTKYPEGIVEPPTPEPKINAVESVARTLANKVGMGQEMPPEVEAQIAGAAERNKGKPTTPFPDMTEEEIAKSKEADAAERDANRVRNLKNRTGDLPVRQEEAPQMKRGDVKAASSEPGITINKAAGYETGLHEYQVSDGTNSANIYQDAENGKWYKIEPPDSPESETLLGKTMGEARDRLKELWDSPTYKNNEAMRRANENLRREFTKNPDIGTTDPRIQKIAEDNPEAAAAIEKALRNKTIGEASHTDIAAAYDVAKENGDPTAPVLKQILDFKKQTLSERIKAAADAAEDKARARIKMRGQRLMSGPPVDDFADLIVIGAAKIAKGTVKFAEWSAEMVKDIGEHVKPFLKDLYSVAKKYKPEDAFKEKPKAEIPKQAELGPKKVKPAPEPKPEPNNKGFGQTRDSDSEARTKAQQEVDLRGGVRKLFNSLVESKGARAEQEESYTAEKAERINKISKIKTPGMAGALERLRGLQGEYEKVDPAKIGLTDNQSNAMMDAINASDKLDRFQKIRATKAIMKLMNGEEIPQRNELQLLDTAFGRHLRSRGGPGASAGYDIGDEARASIDKTDVPLSKPEGTPNPETGEIEPDPMSAEALMGAPKFEDAGEKVASLGRKESFLTKAANFSSKFTRSVLGTHIPGLKLSVHGENEAVRHAIFGGTTANPLKMAQRWAEANYYMVRPDRAVNFMNMNIDDFEVAMEHGMSAKTPDTKGAPLLSEEGWKKWIAKGVNTVTDPTNLFHKTIPALKLKTWKGLTEFYQKNGMEAEEAHTKAAERVNDIYGGMNLKRLERDPGTQKLFRIAALAPDWMESNVRLGRGMGRAIKDPMAIENRTYATGIANFLSSYVALNVMNAMMNDGKFMFQNDVGHELDVAMGNDEKGRVRYFSPYGTAVDMVRLPVSIANAAYHGNIGKAFSDVRARAAEPLQVGMDLMTNTDYVGRTLYNKDRYGKPIPYGQQATNIGKDVISHVAPTGIETGIDWKQGKSSLEQAAAQVLQFPMKYKYPDQPYNALKIRKPRL